MPPKFLSKKKSQKYFLRNYKNHKYYLHSDFLFFLYSIIKYVLFFLDSENFQGDDGELDDEGLRTMIQRRIDNLERRLQAWKSRRQRLHQ